MKSDTRIFNRVFGTIAAFGFFLSLMVHGMTFAGVGVFQRFPLAWLLHLGIFVVFVPFVFSARAENAWSGNLATLFAEYPAWVRWSVMAAGIYAFVNFMLFSYLSEGGVPDVKNGEFVLQNHGRIIRSLTEAEYRLQNIYIARGFSGHWMIFYLAPAFYFLLRAPVCREKTPATPES